MRQDAEPPQRTLDDLLDDLGLFGPYQLRLFCLILIPIMTNAIYNAQFVFTAAAVDYRCLVPECESAESGEFGAGEWREWALVAGERCVRRAPAQGGGCAPGGFTGDTLPCGAWLYENNNTIVAEFGLACREWERALVGTVHSVGVFSALIGVGVVSDSIGRRSTFILTATASAVAGLARAAAGSYLAFLALEFLDALLGAGSYTTGFVLAVEMIDPSKRVLAGCIIASMYAVGGVVLALVAWAVPYWRTLTLVLYAPSLLFPLYFFLMEESVRWLLSRGRKDKAIGILLRAAKFNKKHLSSSTLQHLGEAAEQSRHAAPAPVASVFRQMIRSGILIRRLFICSYAWVTVTFTYYGLSINSVSLGGNMYVNYMLTSLVEIPGYMAGVFLLDRFGRKSSIMGALVVCGLTLITLPFTPNSQRARAALSLAGKMSVSLAFNGMYVQVGELFPTPARHRALAFCSMWARLGQTGAMLTPLLMAYAESLPYLIFGAMSLSAALLLGWTPETLRTRLPDTVAQAEAVRAAGKLRVTRGARTRPQDTADKAPDSAPQTADKAPDSAPQTAADDTADKARDAAQ